MDRFVIISGCSGGGKSTLIDTLTRRGLATVEEPGRRVVREERAAGGSALPWIDPIAFARRITAMARDDYAAAKAMPGPVFFDRGLIDAGVALDHFAGTAALPRLAADHPFHRRVFMAPPWPDLFTRDSERRHDFDQAVAEYDRLCAAYRGLGYAIVPLPRMSVAQRIEAVLATIGGN